MTSSHGSAVVGDVVAAAAVLASWADWIRDDISVAVTLMAGIWYVIQFSRWWKNRD